MSESTSTDLEEFLTDFSYEKIMKGEVNINFQDWENPAPWISIKKLIRDITKNCSQ
jgi:hypothetical protein